MDDDIGAVNGGSETLLVENITFDDFDVGVIYQLRFASKRVAAKIIEDDDPVVVDQSFRNGGANKTGATGDEYCLVLDPTIIPFY